MKFYYKAFELLDDFLDKTILFGYDRIGFAIRQKWWDDSQLQASLLNKVAVITGANSGLGKACGLALAKRGATIYLVCRNPERGALAQQQIMEQTGNINVHLEIVDMSEPAQIKDFSKRFMSSEPHLDLLINNAGVLLNTKHKNSEGIESTFATNTLGYFLMTHLMLPQLLNSDAARIINVSSGGMYGAGLEVNDPLFEKRSYNGLQAYAESKRAEVALAEMWSQTLKDQNIIVSSMHPGWADTKGIQNALPQFHKFTKWILRSPEQGADTIVWLATNSKLQKKDCGHFWFDRKIRPLHRSSKTQYTSEKAQCLWDLCCELGEVEL